MLFCYTSFLFYYIFRHTQFLFFDILLLVCTNDKRNGVFTLQELGTITVSVLKTDDNITSFNVETDNDEILPVSYVIEDTLKKY